MNLMTADERKKLVEDGLKQFHQSEEFRGLLTWLLQEQEKTFKAVMRTKIEDQQKRKKNDKGWNVHYNSALDWVLAEIQNTL